MMSFGLDARNAMEFSSFTFRPRSTNHFIMLQRPVSLKIFRCSIACTTTILSIASRDLAMRFYQNVVKILQDLDKVLVRSYQVLTQILDLRTLKDSYEIFQDFIKIFQDIDSYEIFQVFIKIVSRYYKIYQNRKNSKNTFKMNTSLKDTANDSKQ